MYTTKLIRNLLKQIRSNTYVHKPMTYQVIGNDGKEYYRGKIKNCNYVKQQLWNANIYTWLELIPHDSL